MFVFKLAGKMLRSILLGANIVSVLLMLLCGCTAYMRPEGCLEGVALFSLSFPFYVVANLLFLVFWLVFYLRYVWVSVIGFVLGFGMVRTYCPINFPSTHPEGSLKVMSYNVAGFSLDTYRQKKDSNFVEILNYLSKSEADIVCMQEFNYTKGKYVDKIDEVMHCWAYFDTTNVGKNNCLAICSRLPILRKEVILKNFVDHGNVAYYIKKGDDTIVVINNHFVSNTISQFDKQLYESMVRTPKEVDMKSGVFYFAGKIGNAASQRAIQGDTLAEYVRNLRYPIIVCGDFNDSPLSYVHHLMTDRLQDAFVASGFGPGISYHKSGMYFRLDNIFGSKEWSSYEAQVDNKIAASDHFPVYVFLKLK